MTLNLHALKRYEHWLNENARSEYIIHHQSLSLEDQVRHAVAWAQRIDDHADRSLQEDWSKG